MQITGLGEKGKGWELAVNLLTHESQRTTVSVYGEGVLVKPKGMRVSELGQGEMLYSRELG